MLICFFPRFDRAEKVGFDRASVRGYIEAAVVYRPDYTPGELALIIQLSTKHLVVFRAPLSAMFVF
jgi:hypothetical protein